MSRTSSVNLLLVKVGTEPGLEMIPTAIKRCAPHVKTFGVLNSPHQHHEFDVVVTSSFEATLGAHPECFTENLFVRPELYAEISKKEGQILRIYERVAIHDLTTVKHPPAPTPEFKDSVNDRSQLFLRQAAFWDWALSHYQIDAVVAQNYGHVGWDAVLQAVVGARNIPYLFFHEVRPFLNSLYMHERVEDIGSLALGRQLIEKAVGKESYLADSTERLRVMSEQLGLMTKQPRDSDDGSMGLMARLLQRIGNPRSLPLRLSRSIRRRLRNRESVRDERHSVKHGPLPTNYVFCELQSQPNATTAIKGWMIPDQRESMAMVAKHLPTGWGIVVKESDRQWSRMYPRRRNFWSHIAAIPRVHVVSATMDAELLAQGSRAIIETSYSTLAFKALRRGTPLLLLGQSHITYLPGVFSIKSEQDVADAMQSVDNGSWTQHSVKEIERRLGEFLQESRSATIEGALSSMPTFQSGDERARYVNRVSTNIAGVVSSWLTLRGM